MQNKTVQATPLCRNGYSLLELIVVIAILGVLIASITFNFSPSHSRLKEAARDLYSNMHNARMEAIKRNTNYGIIFDFASNSYAVCAYLGGSCNGDNTTIYLDDYGSGVQFGFGNAAKNATSSGRACPANCTDPVSYNSDSVYFDHKGLSPKLGYVYIENNQKSSLAISTPYLTGNILTKQWSGSNWK